MTSLPTLAATLVVITGPKGGDAVPRDDLSTLALERPPTFPADYFQRLREARNDVLGEKALRQRGDPSWEKVADLLPPLVDYAFLGDETCAEKPLVRPEGGISGYFSAWAQFDPTNERQHWRRALVDGWLPAIEYTFRDDEERVGFVETAFGAPGDDGRLELWVRLREVRDGAESVRFFRCAPEAQPADDGDFDARLASLRSKWSRVLSSGARISVPDETALNGVRASLVQGILTFNGCQPHYGVDGYRAPQHASFPPATITLSMCLMEWGQFARARDILSYYLARLVKPDGTFDYYGPAVSEYGQMLSVCARYVELTGDHDWLTMHLPILQRIYGRILRLRAESKAANPPDSPLHGLIRGLPEADYHGSKDEWQKFYYSGDCWCARGLRQMGRALTSLSEATGDDAYARQGEALIAESDAYADDINRSLRASLIETPDGPFVPPSPGFEKPFEFATESRHASYCNYRYYPEMMSSGILEPDLLDAVVRFRRTCGGELLGMTRFEGWLDDWPIWNYARCLMDRDEGRRMMLLFYAHLAHHQSRGTFTAYEQAPFDPEEKGDRAFFDNADEVPATRIPVEKGSVPFFFFPVRKARAGQCAPSQVAAPLMLKWMLCYEPFDEDTLWLCRAVPREWTRAGIKCSRLPTRWGPVGLDVREEPKRNVVRAVLRLPASGIPADLNLRLRHPDGKRLRSVTVDGKSWKRFTRGTATIRLGKGRMGRVEVKARYGGGPG